MFQPVGNQSTSVYWRRRFVLIAAIVVVLVLAVLTVRAMSSNASGPARHLGAGKDPQPSSPPNRPAATTSASSASHSTAPRGHHRHSTESRHSAAVSDSPSPSAGQSSTQGAAAQSSTAPPPRCAAKDLDVQAVVAHPTYKVGQHPEVELQVTNVGAQPCVQDLADKQVELKIYNGESRVWGSHDCQIEPGTADRTLEVDSPVRVSIIWSGLTSQPGCAGTRQRVGAGTYTLYATLSGHSGKATQFSIT